MLFQLFIAFFISQSAVADIKTGKVSKTFETPNGVVLESDLLIAAFPKIDLETRKTPREVIDDELKHFAPGPLREEHKKLRGIELVEVNEFKIVPYDKTLGLAIVRTEISRPTLDWSTKLWVYRLRENGKWKPLSSIEVDEDSRKCVFDFAPFKLNERERAFGRRCVFQNDGSDPSARDGSKTLSLFRLHENRLTKIFHEDIERWGTDPANTDGVQTVEDGDLTASLIVEEKKGASHYDWILKGKATVVDVHGKKTLSINHRYSWNGTEYVRQGLPQAPPVATEKTAPTQPQLKCTKENAKECLAAARASLVGDCKGALFDCARHKNSPAFCSHVALQIQPALEAKDPEAYLLKGLCEVTQEGALKKEACGFFQKATELGNSDAVLAHAACYSGCRSPLPADFEKSFAILKTAEEKLKSDPFYSLGLSIYVWCADSGNAKRYFKVSADRKSTPGLTGLMASTFNEWKNVGKGSEEHPLFVEALSLYEKLKTKDSANSFFEPELREIGFRHECARLKLTAAEKKRLKTEGLENDSLQSAETLANASKSKRSYRLAKFLICSHWRQNELADLEAELMVSHLVKMEGSEPTLPFRVCDHISSKYNAGLCLDEK